MRPRTLVSIGALALVSSVGLYTAVAPAQETTAAPNADDGYVVLHEYFDPGTAYIPSANEALAGAAGMSDGVMHNGVRIPRPPGAEPSPRTPDEPTWSQEGPRSASDGRPMSDHNGPGNANAARDGLSLDSDTDKEGRLNYTTVFNPSVVPFKRVGAMDRIVKKNGRYRVEVADTTFRRLDTLGEVTPQGAGRDRFWGSLLVDAVPNRVVPIPSVAPGARILDVETKPEVDPIFVIDGAGNMGVRIDHDGPVRINFLTDASEYYFRTDVPSGISLDQPPEDLPGGRRAFVGVEPSLEPVAARIATEVGISTDMQLDEALPLLVAYFRDFETVDLGPRLEGDLLLDITVQKRGVCRHRGFGFMLAAQHVNIPTRYVYNEAHAFVEVFVSMRGWTRIDLGGGAEALDVASNDDTVRHNAGSDPFPQPDNYRENYSRVAREQPSESMGGFDSVTGLPRLPEEVEETVDDIASDANYVDGDGDGTASSDDGAPSDRAPDGVTRTQDGNDVLDDGGGDDDTTDVMPSPIPQRALSRLDVEPIPDSALRGSPVTVAGSLRAFEGDVPLEGREVEIVLSPLDGTTGTPRVLGTARTDALGEFETEVELPQTLPVGTWDLFARFAGDGDWQDSRSD